MFSTQGSFKRRHFGGLFPVNQLVQSVSSAYSAICLQTAFCDIQNSSPYSRHPFVSTRARLAVVPDAFCLHPALDGTFLLVDGSHVRHSLLYRVLWRDYVWW